MLLEVLGEADAEVEQKEGEGGGQEGGVQDQASGSLHEEGQGSGDVDAGVRPQSNGGPEGEVSGQNKAPGELRPQRDQVRKAPQGVNQDKGGGSQGGSDAKG